MLDKKQEAELIFWKDLYESLGQFYHMSRRNDYIRKTVFFPGIECEIGKGLDLGCGLLSIFEHSSLIKCCQIYAIDPLLEEYKKIAAHHNSSYYVDGHRTGGLIYVEQEDPNKIPFGDEMFNWVFCVNVMDHTSDEDALWKEIYRVLCRGGRLYFGVNFDPVLTAPHYKLWTESMVLDRINRWDFQLWESYTTPGEYEGQTLYWCRATKGRFNL